MAKEISRFEQKLENTWDLSTVYSDLSSYQKDYNSISSYIDKLENFKGIITENPDNLYSALKLDEEANRILEKLATYAYRKYDEDITDIKNQELMGGFDKLYQTYITKTSYIIPELLKNDYDYIKNFIDNKQELKEYSLLLERIFQKKPYTLNEQEENVIASLQMALSESEKIASIIRNSEVQLGTILDEDNKEVALTNANYLEYNKSNNRRVRKDAFMTLYNNYSKYKETLTETLQGHIASVSSIFKIRGFSDTKTACLFNNRVDPKVYDNLIDTVHNRMDVIHKYITLKKEILNLDDFSLYDTYINLEADCDKKYSFDDAKKLVLEVVEVFGEEYKQTVERAFKERWIDIYPNKGKRGGAYSSGSYDTNPFILLNYSGNYHDVSTLAHELGHSMHTYFSNKNNSYIYSNYKIFVAEVASTVNELLLNFHMLEKSNDSKEKRYILSEMMELFKSTIYRQTMFSEFEEFLYKKYEEGNTLTNKLLCDKYYELNKLYFGDNVIVNNEIRYEWERVPHFYYNFYVYQYATGLSAACYIVNRIRNNDKKAVSDYLNFLKTGDSLDPVDELKVAGVDMLNPDVINSAIDMFNDIIEQYKEIVRGEK